MSAQVAVQSAQDVPDVCSGSELPDRGPDTPHAIHRYTVRFTGHGQSYWPVALKNGALLVLSLGLWWPWARAQMWRYVAAHTQIDGVQPELMMRSTRSHYVFLPLVVALWLCIWSRSSHPTLAWASGLTALALWPAWWHQAYQTQLEAPRWQGLGWRVKAKLSQTYRLWAVPLIGLTSLLGLGMILALLGSGGAPHNAGLISLITLCIGGLGMVPYMHWRIIRHQQHHLVLQRMPMRFRGTALDLYRIWAHAMLMGAMSMTAALGLYGVVAFWAWSVLPAGASHTWLQTMASMVPVGLTFAAFSLVLPASYLQTHVHNLRWSHTGSEWIRFKSYLKTRDQLSMNAKHLVKLLCSVGLYWPYAAMQGLAARMHSVTIVTRLSAQQWQEMTRSARPDQAA